MEIHSLLNEEYLNVVKVFSILYSVFLDESEFQNPSYKIHISTLKSTFQNFIHVNREFFMRVEFYYLIIFFRSVSTLFSHFNNFKV